MPSKPLTEEQREKKRERQRVWYAANREKARAWRAANREKTREKNRAWYEANREKKREKNRAWYEANREKVSEQRRARYAANPEKERARYAANLEKYMLTRARIRAKKAAIDFNIGLDDIKIPEYCPYFTKRKIDLNAPGKMLSPSLDRIDTSKGYVKGNVVVCSNEANICKRDMLPEEILTLAVNVYKLLGIEVRHELVPTADNKTDQSE